MRKLYAILAALTAVIALSVCWAADVSGTSPTVAAIGSAASPFSLQNQDGKIVNLSDYAGKILVLEWTNPECPFVQRHYQAHTMTTLAAKYQPQGVAWVAINSTHDVTDADNKTWATQQALPYPVLNDATGTVGHSYGATNTPEMYVIGKDGKLMYKGAIDNDRDGDLTTGKINYVDQALSEILAGKPVSVTETKAYGCTVHYATN
jgi:peroxiredoxin